MSIRRAAALVALLAAAAPVCAMDYVSVSDTAAVLYDAPSLKAKKLFVVSRYSPLEQVVSLNGWIKVRTGDGSLAWVEKRAVSGKRYVAVTAELAALRQAPDGNSAMVMQAKQQVVLERLENTGTGWIKVRHADGVTGYVKTTEVWGD